MQRLTPGDVLAILGGAAISGGWISAMGFPPGVAVVGGGTVVLLAVMIIFLVTGKE